MRGLAWVAVAGLVGCSATNPAYQVDGESGPEPTTTATSSAEASAGDSSSGDMVCQVHPQRPISISLSTEDGVALLPDCSQPGIVTRLGQGNNQFPPGLPIQHRDCGASCPCMDGPSVFIELGPNVMFADDLPLPGCGDIALWSYRAPDGTCEWAGIVLYDGGDALPEYIASNTLSVPPLAFLGPQALTLGLVEPEPCEQLAGCDASPSPGRYALDILGQTTVAAEPPPAFVDIEFLMGGTIETYLFDNRMSSVSPACEVQVAWTAQHRPLP